MIDEYSISGKVAEKLLQTTLYRLIMADKGLLSFEVPIRIW